MVGVIAVSLLCFPSILFASPEQSQLIVPQNSSFKNSLEPNLIGMRLNENNPLLFDFLVDRGEAMPDGEELKTVSEKLIKYFLSAMTIPDRDSWVNLSPYEKERIIPEFLGSTEMGKTMLEQDYLLKQRASALTHPETELGKKFWEAVQKYAFERFGNSEVPANTFNKVWIVPQKAVVVEDNGQVYIAESQLKVMMEEDYIALSNQKDSAESFAPAKDINSLSSDIFRQMIMPVLEKEINESEAFAPVRQIYQGVILAAWYKKNLRDSLLGQIYLDQSKIVGVDIPDKNIKMKIYDQYLETFRKGAYSLIKEDLDLVTQEMIPRKYFSGGTTFASTPLVEVAQEEPVAQALKGRMLAGFVSRRIVAANVELAEQATIAQGLNGDTTGINLEIGDIPLGPFGAEWNLTHDADQLNEEYDLYRALDSKGKETALTMLLLGTRRGVSALELALRYPNLRIVAVNKQKDLWNNDISFQKLFEKGYPEDQLNAARLRITVIENLNVDNQSQREFILGEQKFDFVVMAENFTLYANDQMQLIEQVFNDSVKPGGFYAFQVAPAYVSSSRNFDERESGLMEGLDSEKRLMSVIKSAFSGVAFGLRTEFPSGKKNYFTLTRSARGQAVKVPLQLITSFRFAPRTKTTFQQEAVVSRYGPLENVETQPDQDQLAAASAVTGNDFTKGGIDFNPALLDLQIKRNGKGIALPLAQQNVKAINVEGFYPAILSINPVLQEDLPSFVSAN